MKKRLRIRPPLLKRAREMRHEQTPEEATLWRALRNRGLQHKFRRQYPIEKYIVDFYCAESKVCVEVDGGGHFEKAQEEYDAYRTVCLESLGYKVMRFTNEDVRFRIHAVVEEIEREIDDLHPHL